MDVRPLLNRQDLKTGVWHTPGIPVPVCATHRVSRCGEHNGPRGRLRMGLGLSGVKKCFHVETLWVSDPWWKHLAKGAGAAAPKAKSRGGNTFAQESFRGNTLWWKHLVLRSTKTTPFC